MKPEVRDAFPSFTERFEGRCGYMYLDVEGLVTTGAGILIDPMAMAVTLPWKRLGGASAAVAEIAGAWLTVKRRQDMRKLGGGAFEKLTNLRLEPDGIDRLTLDKLDDNECVMVRRFRNWDDLPWQAQLATHSLAWACGPNFKFPNFEEALLLEDWNTCANEVVMNATGNPGLAPRNRANVALFEELIPTTAA